MDKTVLQNIHRDSIEGHVPLKNIGLDLVVLFYEEMTKRGKKSEDPGGPLIRDAKKEAAEWFPEMTKIVHAAADATTGSKAPDSGKKSDAFSDSIAQLSLALQAASTLFVSNNIRSNDLILEDIGAKYLECRGALPEEDEKKKSGVRKTSEDRKEHWDRKADMVERLTSAFFQYHIDDKSRGKAINALMDFGHDNTEDKELWNTVLAYLDSMGLSENQKSSVLVQERQDLLQTLRRVQPDVVRYFLYRCNELADNEFVGVKDRFLREKQYSYDEDTKKFYEALQVLESAYIDESFQSEEGGRSRGREMTRSMDAHLLFFRLLGKAGTESEYA